MRAACALRGADGPASGTGSGVRERIVKLLLDSGLSTDAADAQGNTPLHLAASRGLSTVCELLLNAGANASACNGRAETPSDLAQAAAHEQLAARLKESQASGGVVAGVHADAPGAGRVISPTKLPTTLAPIGAVRSALPPLDSTGSTGIQPAARSAPLPNLHGSTVFTDGAGELQAGSAPGAATAAPVPAPAPATES